MSKGSKNTETKRKGLTDPELIAKYETGKRFNLDKILKVMGKNRTQLSVAKK